MMEDKVKYLTKKEISAAYASNESRSSELLEDNKKNKIKKKMQRSAPNRCVLTKCLNGC